jgi:PAS domain S-box-containing protein
VLAKVLVDGDGRIVRVNPAFTRLLGHARTALEGRALEDLVHPDDRATGPAPLPSRRRYLHRDGSVLWVQHTATPLRLADGHDYQLAELLDVTEAHRLEAQLREAQKLEAVGQLAGGIAHDFNNLLTVIRGNLGFLRDAIPPVGEAADDLTQVEHAAARATVLVRQLLAFGRRQVLHPRAVALEGVVADAARLLRRTLGDGVTLTVRRAGHAGAVWADPGQLEQVVVHLALNARDAIDRAGRGGGTITIETATVRFVAPGVPDAAGAALLGRDGLLTAGGDAPLAAGRYAALVVRDTGAGMTPAVRARLFEPFFTTKDVGEGSGLGLATVHGIVAQSGGALHVQSVPGRGSAFAVLLPQAPAGDAVATAPRGAAGPVPG